MKKVIDLRSDTLTLPPKEMLETILTAKLGDDVWREDPTVQELEVLAAKILGKEAGLLVTSGTQGNLVSEMTHLNKGEGIILEAESHIYLYEAGGIASIVGALPYLIRGDNGLMDPKDIEAILSRPYNVHYADPKLVCIENTHNRGGGRVIPKSNMDEIAKLAHDYEVPVHIDGARLFNASVALDISPAKLVEHADSIQICLSKGLACPIGSIIVGTEEFIEKARKNRKRVGGGMRQAGVIAAPGIYALNHMIDRLKEDHDHAKMIEKVLREKENIIVKPVDTNIVIIDLSDSEYNANTLSKKLEKQGVLVTQMGEQLIRFVTHFNISREDIEKVVKVLSEAF
ncbi:MAG: aminotransferase class I/II-fold pyridoxal phosphate-dependent enzyme [Candidatus Heimdallarchaeum aukensis]|uniref:Aminotransferase class I/II-fold pyridoxal phosphate-dependent enzyme n=1 Tax=Candidatus Heimdallarchaeum aukensis TaxID=2876573 RepID=A0A9Y1FLL4_9ARCH|nr:MAG: aminotransferase class I/II-fold pyridoxal phosphate-dependent enzyme [Candidatus Heimdallarchaeum aukensis]